MCGICGYISKKQYSKQLITDMNNTMIHRGPDDCGVFLSTLSDGRQIALGHRRLSILDLSEAGHQPMHSDDGAVTIVYNGEIYNFKELRDDLKKKGYTFVSECDTEVVLKLYLEYGEAFLPMLNGMFAIAIFDSRSDKLLLARDRFGKKPLHFYVSPDKKDIAFASELKSVLVFPGIEKKIKKELILSYLVNSCIVSPNTIFEDIYKVEPGQYIVISGIKSDNNKSENNKSENIERKSYFSLIDVAASSQASIITDIDVAKKELQELLLDSVSKRLMADVPVGAYLSGGIDSTLITALACKVSEDKVNTFTIGFNHKEENEATYAKEISDYLGTNHTEQYISEADLFDELKDLVKYYDEPFLDSSQIPSMLVAKLAKQKASVVLSGDGGDELFCGYDEYDLIYKMQRLDGLGGVAHSVLDAPLINRMKLIDKLPYQIRGVINNRDPRYKLQAVYDEREKIVRSVMAVDSNTCKYDYEALIHEEKRIPDNWQLQRMLLDMRYYLGDEVLQKVDRASMKYSLEVRCPLLDHRVLEYSLRLSHDLKYHDKEKKYILKQLLYDMVPRELVDRPKKGFGVPRRAWLMNELKEQLEMYCDEVALEKQGIFSPAGIRNIIDKMNKDSWWFYDQVVWGFLVFQMWYQEYIEDLWK